MENRWCSSCGILFMPRAQAPRQAYCANPVCQRERRRLWQQSKRRVDPDYASNQIDAQRAWAARNPDYWSAYRESHPDYVKRNRVRQRERNQSRAAQIAKMDAPTNAPSLQDGVYELRLHAVDGIAKMDVWTVRLTVLSTP